MKTGSPTHSRARTLGRAALAFALAYALLGATAVSAIAADKPAPLVVVVLSPFLTWSDLSPTSTPAMWSMASTGAVGNMNSLTADQGWPTVAGGSLTISAGRWAATAPGSPGAPASLPALRAANAASLEPPQLGALGAAIHAAGGHTAAVGFGSTDKPGPAGTSSPAALLAMDGTGLVDFGDTSESLLATATARVSPTQGAAPLARTASDPLRTSAAIRAALDDLAAARGPALLVVDPGDLARAHDATAQTQAQAASLHGSAVKTLDATVDGLSTRLPSGALLLVVTPATDKPYYEPPYLGPTIASGRGFVGNLTSSSTHRPGLVANLDVAPTVLAALGVPKPETMIGQPMRSLPTSAPLAVRLAALSRLGTTVGAVDYLRDLYFMSLFVGITIPVLALAVALALLPLPSVRFVGRWWILGVLAVPPAAWLMYLVERFPATPQRALIALGIATAATFAIALAISLLVRKRPELPLLFLATFTSLVICADQWLGKPLESGLFSYSIRAGWRYYGMGNEGAALLVGASLAAIGLACDLAADKPWALALRRFGIPAVGVVAVVTAAAPFAGANAGVAVWGLIAFAVAWVVANQLRFTWKTIAAMALAIVALVGAFVVLDMVRGSGSETHLGRFVSDIVAGGPSALAEFVRRKAINNVNYLPQTPYSWLALGLAVSLALVRWVPPRPLVPALAARPAYAGALLGVLVGGVAALLTEDSGIVMPALMLLAGALPALYLVLLQELPTKTASGPAE